MATLRYGEKEITIDKAIDALEGCGMRGVGMIWKHLSIIILENYIWKRRAD